MKLNNCINGQCTLKENISDDKPFIVLEGVIQKADTENHNGLIYTKEVLVEALNVYQVDYIDRGLSYLELDHPDDRDSENKATYMVGLMTNIWWEGDLMMGSMRIPTDTVNGKIIKAIYDIGGKIGISSRGVGSTDGNIVTELVLSAFDLVPQPSVHEAVLTLTESIKGIKNDYSKIDIMINNILNKY